MIQRLDVPMSPQDRVEADSVLSRERFSTDQPPLGPRDATSPYGTAERPTSPTRDWRSRDVDSTRDLHADLRNPERVLRDPHLDLQQPTSPQRRPILDPHRRPDQRPSPRHAAEPDDDDEHFFDEDERLAMGDDDEYDHPKARVSWLAVSGLVLGVTGTLCALSGDLAPIGFFCGVLGLMLAVGGFVAASQPDVASQPLALFALVLTVGALALSVLALTGEVDWLNRTNQAGWLRDWFNDRIPSIANW